jgi:hypothetical protein
MKDRLPGNTRLIPVHNRSIWLIPHSNIRVISEQNNSNIRLISAPKKSNIRMIPELAYHLNNSKLTPETHNSKADTGTHNVATSNSWYIPTSTIPFNNYKLIPTHNKSIYLNTFTHDIRLIPVHNNSNITTCTPVLYVFEPSGSGFGHFLALYI